jgi:hypothetical protein
MKKQSTDYIDPRRAATTAAHLAALPGTQSQIRLRSSLCRTTVTESTIRLHGEHIHIGKFVPAPRGGPSLAFWVAGPGKDAVDDLPNMTSKETNDRYLARIKGTERDDKRLAHNRSRRWQAKAKTTPQHVFSALFVGVRASVNGEG